LNNSSDEYSIIDKKRIIYNYFNLNINEAYIQKLNPPRENNSASKELRKLVKYQSRKPSYNVLNELRAVRISFEDDLSTKLNIVKKYANGLHIIFLLKVRI
jgi:hypothetical protein